MGHDICIKNEKIKPLKEKQFSSHGSPTFLAWQLVVNDESSTASISVSLNSALGAFQNGKAEMVASSSRDHNLSPMKTRAALGISQQSIWIPLLNRI